MSIPALVYITTPIICVGMRIGICSYMPNPACSLRDEPGRREYGEHGTVRGDRRKSMARRVVAPSHVCPSWRRLGDAYNLPR
jgi:hypothetical protein